MKHHSKKQNRGEAWVWMTALGLCMGLVMVVGLLGLIFFQGLGVFWPKQVVAFQIEDPQNHTLANLAGEITLEKDHEWQVFLGNKDLYGQGFRFIATEQIKNITYPKDILLLERLEYGDAIAYPLELSLASGQKVLVQEANFTALLKSTVAAAKARWKQIAEIEKNHIGKINLAMEKSLWDRKKLEEKNLAPEKLAKKLQKISEQESRWQAAYQVLADEAKRLRGIQEQDQLRYRLASGEEQSLAIGQIVSFYYPNQLSWLDRAGHFLLNIGNFLSSDPREANTEGGVFPAIFGTFVMTILMSLAVVPFGVLAAIYLREYAKQGLWIRTIRIAINNLAGVPSIVFGVFGLGFFVYFMGSGLDHIFFPERLPTPTFGTGGILWAALTLALMTVPVVIVSTEEAIASVSHGMREGALACGASKWQTIARVVLPSSAPGILTGMILAMARGAGEVAPLMLVGVVKLAPSLPLNNVFPYIHLDQKFMHLGFYIFDLGFQSPDSDAAKPMVFAATLLLIVLVVLMNLGAIVLRERLRKKYATSTF